jgi:hypothetical protein
LLFASLLLAYVSTFSALIPVIAGLNVGKKFEPGTKLIVWLAVVGFIADCVSFFFAHLSINSWPEINLFLLVQVVFLFLILSYRSSNLVLKIAFGSCITWGVVNFLFFQGPTRFNSYTSYACGILMITMSLHILYTLVKDNSAERMQTLPIFWICFGTLIYYGGTLFLFLFTNYMVLHLPNTYPIVWMLHNLLNITKNVFLFLALWTIYKHRTSQH